MSDNAHTARIHKYYKKVLIHKLGKGIYGFGPKMSFKPNILPQQKNVYNDIKSRYPDINIIIWSTTWMAEFMYNVSFNYLILIEVEKGFEEPVFNHLRERNYPDIYFKPSKQEIDKYVGHNYETIIVKSQLTKSPYAIFENIKIARPEKFLVDLLCDEKLFSAYQFDLKAILRGFEETYNLDFTKLITYSRRRGKREIVKKFLLDLFPIYSFIHDF